MTKCPHCGHEFHNVMRYRDCPKCSRPLDRAAADRQPDDGFDAAGFAVGMMTGVPLSPTRGFSTGAMIGAALHSEPHHSTPAPDPAPSYSPPDTSSSPSFDSGSSGGGGFSSDGT